MEQPVLCMNEFGQIMIRDSFGNPGLAQMGLMPMHEFENGVGG